jgi:hypothetical protein
LNGVGKKRYTTAADVFVEIAKNYSGKCAPLKKKLERYSKL